MKMNFDIDALPTPYYLVKESLLQKNLERLKEVMDKTGCHILLAQKAFSMYALYPLIGQYLSGTTASGLFEARLGFEEMSGENHIFSPAYLEQEFDQIVEICDHIIFNSFTQLNKFKGKALEKNRKIGLRINPECSTQDHAIYDPCSAFSRLGITRKNFRSEQLQSVSGLHFHTLCEQNADALVKTLDAVEEKFGEFLPQMEWVNFGGGHHITREDYDIDILINAVNNFKEKYQVQIYLEPGEAVALNAGFLVSSVLDIIDNGMQLAIMDSSAACHMPDVLEMPYRPNILSAGLPGEKQFCYRLGGSTCLAGDIIGEYSFDKPLAIGDRLVFCDMAHYSMVKNNTFNGMNLPSIAIAKTDDNLELVKSFGYEDFKGRLS